jgi:hypothetical protein
MKTVAALRGTVEFDAWMQGLCDAERMPRSVIIERALALYSERVGYEPPPLRSKKD